MDFLSRAKIRLENWIAHSGHHQEEYTSFARELEQAGKTESAKQIREMIALSARGEECLRAALQALEPVCHS